MKIARRILVGMAGLIAILVVAGLFLPSSMHVERSTVIEASPESVYEIVSDFDRFNEWSPWYALDPDAEYIYSKSTTGVGATFAWKSEKPEVGSGSQQILQLEENRLVRLRLDFGSQGTAVASYTLEPQGSNSTRVTWGFDTDFGFDLIGRYVGLMLDTWIGNDYERGLANLKSVAEKAPAAMQDSDS